MIIWTSVEPQNLQLKLWEKVSLVAGDDSDAGLYDARVEDFADGHIIVSRPELIKGKTLLRENLHVVVRATRQDAIYEFESTISKIPNDPLLRVTLTAPQALRRIQRRLFVRIDVHAAARYTPVRNILSSLYTVDNAPWYSAELFDVSGGGALVATTENFEAGETLLLTSELFTEVGVSEYILVRTTRMTEREHRKAVGVEFVLAEEVLRVYSEQELSLLPTSARKFGRVAQNKLVNFIFNQQIRLRQEGRP